MKIWRWVIRGSLSALCVACGGDGSASSNTNGAATDCDPGTTQACACDDGTSGLQPCSADGASYGACDCTGTTSTGGAGSGGTAGTTSTGGSAGTTDPGTGGATNPGTGGTTDPGTGGIPDPGTGGVTDPGGGVQVSGIACGGVLDQNFLPPFVELGGRQVYVDYACNKPSGTAVTFILNLHGTMAQEEGKIYQRGYFPAYNYVDSHDFIIATPKSVVSQWGNGDGGQDEPHLMAVIDWVYENFASFDIQQMWIVGHSWGAMYARTFACKPELQDKVHGVVLMSGGSSMPACADRLAAIGTVGETDIVPGELTQQATASAHGCDAQTTTMVGNTRVTEWPSCDPGWVHKNYFMLGKGHGFSPVDWPEEAMTIDLVETIAGAR